MQNSSKYSSILLIESGNFPVNMIVYFDDLGNKITIKDSIQRITTKEDQEFVGLENGLSIDIKKIYSVDGELSPHYTDEYFKCDCV